MQVTSNEVRLVSSTTRELRNTWFAPAGYSVNVGTANSTQVCFQVPTTNYNLIGSNWKLKSDKKLTITLSIIYSSHKEFVKMIQYCSLHINWSAEVIMFARVWI